MTSSHEILLWLAVFSAPNCLCLIDIHTYPRSSWSFIEYYSPANCWGNYSLFCIAYLLSSDQEKLSVSFQSRRSTRDLSLRSDFPSRIFQTDLKRPTVSDRLLPSVLRTDRRSIVVFLHIPLIKRSLLCLLISQTSILTLPSAIIGCHRRYGS